MRIAARWSAISGMLLTLGLMIPFPSQSSPPKKDATVDAVITGLPLYSVGRPTVLLIGGGPSISQIGYSFQLGRYQYNPSRGNGPFYPIDLRSFKWQHSQFNEAKAQQPFDLALVLGLRDAFKRGYRLGVPYQPTDLSCMRHGLDSFLLNVTFNDGATAYVVSSFAIVAFQDAIPVSTKKRNVIQDAKRINVPNEQLTDDMRIFGIMVAAAYANPCTNQLALQKLGDGRAKRVTFKRAHLPPPLPMPPET